MSDHGRCGGLDCDRDAVAGGLCLMHYKRKWRGRPLADPLIARLGEPDGHGRFGYLDGDDRLLCHECGRSYVGLAAHVAGAHEMSADEYRAAHGLARGTTLLGAEARERMSANASSRLGSPAWERFEQRRDPTAASHARERPGVDAGAAAAAARPARARANGVASRKARVWTCPVCGAQWCLLSGKKRHRFCGPDCHRLGAAATSKALAATRYRPLTDSETATLLELRGSVRLPAAILQIVTGGVSQARVARALGMSAPSMSRLLAPHRKNTPTY